MYKQSKRILTLLVAALTVGLLWGSLTLSAPPPGKGGGKGGGGGDKTVPDGPGMIAFVNSRTIFHINPDGSGLTSVADFTGQANPAWSPMFADGSVKIFYNDVVATGVTALMVVDVIPDLGTPVPVLEVADGAGMFQVDVSQLLVLEDGTETVRVSFRTFLDDGDSAIQIVDLSYDSGLFTVGSVSPAIPSGPGVTYYQASFSPDGQWLALERGATLADGSVDCSIWLLSADGETQQPLIDCPGSFDGFPAWSPDGSELAFISDRDGRRRQVYVASLNDALSVVSENRVTSRGKDKGWPTWSPDGLQIAYHEAGTIRKVLDTGEQFKLVDGSKPNWSP
jgi:hypothetical protein